ncbi:MAG: DUF356 domain-containing protein [Methanobacteriaceae archaeon]|nr:DUF356 domain-containing protein [Methanobacteriaceae archaeon]
MSLILIRALNKSKLLNSISDVERYANLKLIGKPKLISSEKADKIAEKILKQKLRTESRISAIINVKAETTKTIMQIKKIHPPAHITVISEEYDDYNHITELYENLAQLDGYYSPKTNNYRKSN